MTDSALYLPSTLLRRTYELSRSQDLSDQIRECADHLSNPQLLAGELIDAYQAICSFDESELPAICELEKKEVEGSCGELVLEYFHAGQKLSVEAQPPVRMRCLATNVRPVMELCPSGEGLKDGVDYIAVGMDGEVAGTPMLGVAQSYDDTSAYALLLRGLACLTELATDARVEILNQQWLAGSLRGEPCFELHLILWDEEDRCAEDATLRELSRDLAEVARDAMAAEPGLAARLGTIRCLRMDPGAFSGALGHEWSI